MSAVPAATSVADRIERIPRPDEPVPALAAPTVALFAAALALWLGSGAMLLADVWAWPLSTALNWLAAFMFFTVVHEASHRTISTREEVNTWFGRVSMLFLDPVAPFQLFRFVHMQHHRFTNDEEKDPDFFSSHGKGWSLPFRWALIDINYLRYYVPQLGSRPQGERSEAIGTFLLAVTIATAAIALGYGFELLVLWIVPSRLAILGLGFAFDYLPHHGLPSPEKPDQFKTTRNRVGLERLLTPLLLYQNYHLVHHLHPIIPFYRYIAVWRRNEDRYLTREPPLVTPLGRPLTVDEYRRLRELH